MAKLSVCVITKNEEARIERCLSSIQWADEIIVVDSGSNDRTVELAEKAAAKVIYSEWPGWALQKNKAINLARHDWILSLDADEWLPDTAEKIIREAMNSSTADGYYLRRRTFFLGSWMRRGGWYPDQQIRLFKKSVTRFEEVPVHEKVIPPQRSAFLDLDIWHESYVSLAQYFSKNKKYAAAQAEQQVGQKFLLIKFFIKPAYRFVQTYFLQLGFLDGAKGLLLAFLRSWYEWRVMTEIFRLRSQPRNQQEVR